MAKKESQVIKVSLTMCCTARLRTKIAIVESGLGYCFIPLTAESTPSSFLSLEEVQIGKVLGKGSYELLFHYFLKRY